jgi:hypothetical protein|nr:MAG TPA: hypothetical protein [Caudoviricetes sp.]
MEIEICTEILRITEEADDLKNQMSVLRYRAVQLDEQLEILKEYEPNNHTKAMQIINEKHQINCKAKYLCTKIRGLRDQMLSTINSKEKNLQ